MAEPYYRVLVVDDFEPVRNLICSKLGSNPQLQVVAQASDGLEAVEKAEELQPELILLDLSLPKLHGLKAAVRILKVSPGSKIVFVSQESNNEVIEEAMRIGAKGYVVKTDIADKLLPGIAAVFRGENFISSRLGNSEKGGDPVAYESTGATTHAVSFYPDDASLVDGLSRCITSALDSGRVAVAVLTEPHRASVLRKLRAYRTEIDVDVQQGRLVMMNVADARAIFSLDDKPDESKFVVAARSFIDRVVTHANSEGAKLVVCGECAATLLAEGEVDGTIHLEQLLNFVLKIHGDITIQCAYVSNQFENEATDHLFHRICAEHSAVLAC